MQCDASRRSNLVRRSTLKCRAHLRGLRMVLHPQQCKHIDTHTHTHSLAVCTLLDPKVQGEIVCRAEGIAAAADGENSEQKWNLPKAKTSLHVKISAAVQSPKWNRAFVFISRNWQKEGHWNNKNERARARRCFTIASVIELCGQTFSVAMQGWWRVVLISGGSLSACRMLFQCALERE